MKPEKLTAKLAYSQLLTNRRRTLWTLLGIVLSTAMLTAVYGFAASGIASIIDLRDGDANFINTYSTIFIGVGAVLSAVVAAASVIVISNAFRVSAGDRIQQFGILKSVGATKRQIQQTVMYEAILLSAVGIPAGILTGLAVQFLGLQISDFLLADFNRLNRDFSLVFSFVIAWQAIVVSIVMAWTTVMLSAWLPALKAAKVAAIDAIRGAGEVKLKAKQVRSNWLVKKLFGFEGQLASKSIKRNKRNLRATVVSLTVSIVMFIAATGVGVQMETALNLRFIDSDTNVVGSFFSSTRTDPDTGERRTLTIDNAIAEAVTARLRAFPDTTVVGLGRDTDSFRANIPANYFTSAAQAFSHLPQYDDGTFSMPVTLITVDAETYAHLCQRAGVPIGSNILVNQFRAFDWETGRLIEFTPHIFNNQTLFNLRSYGGELPLHGEIRSLPGELMEISRYQIAVIVPELSTPHYLWLAATHDPNGFEQHTRYIFDEMLAPKIDVDAWVYGFGFHANFGVINIAASTAAERSLVRLITVFIYGFVGMLTLIGLTNVISTISTNVRARSREFAILQSVGMTQGGISRMLNLESILCSLKSLMFGLPLGIGASLLTYRAIQGSFRFAYRFPWLAIAQVILAVFIITWAAMRYSAARLRSRNIMEEVRR